MVGDTVNIFPSRANFVYMKARIVAANRGLNLMKRKRDALELKLREIMAALAEQRESIIELLMDAMFAISRARFLGTDFKPATYLSVERAAACLRIKHVKVVGLLLPTFVLTLRNSESYPLTGLSRGGIQVEIIRKKFREVLTRLISIASMEYSIKVLKESLHQTNTRLNGLEHVLIPRFNNTLTYIRNELDEYDREDFYRLKCSQRKQKANKANFQAMVLKKAGARNKTTFAETLDTPFELNEFNRVTDERRKSQISRHTLAMEASKSAIISQPRTSEVAAPRPSTRITDPTGDPPPEGDPNSDDSQE